MSPALPVNVALIDRVDLMLTVDDDVWQAADDQFACAIQAAYASGFRELPEQLDLFFDRVDRGDGGERIVVGDVLFDCDHVAIGVSRPREAH